MEHKITKCPYCGEEILAEAKKCKHCGEWLDKDATEKVSNVVEKESVSDDEEYDWSWLYKVIVFIVIIAIGISTLPSEEEQNAKIMEELRVEFRKEIRSEIRGKDLFTQALGKGVMSDDEVVDRLIRKHYSISINNYKLLSTITAEDKETGEVSICGIAGFGFVYTNILFLLPITL